MMRTIVAAIVGTAALAMAARAEEACTSPENPAKAFPGITLGKTFPAVKDRVPASAGCASKTKEFCNFVDRYGIENHFSDFRPAFHGGEERELFERTEIRRRGGWLPYGVKWSDNFAQAMSKLKSHGGKVTASQPRIIYVIACWSRQSDSYSVDFEFDEAGRLVKVEQGYQAY